MTAISLGKVNIDEDENDMNIYFSEDMAVKALLTSSILLISQPFPFTNRPIFFKLLRILHYFYKLHFVQWQKLSG